MLEINFLCIFTTIKRGIILNRIQLFGKDKNINMTTKERYEGVLGWFAGKMPVAESELKYNDPSELIVAVILSAQ